MTNSHNTTNELTMADLMTDHLSELTKMARIVLSRNSLDMKPEELVNDVFCEKYTKRVPANNWKGLIYNIIDGRAKDLIRVREAQIRGGGVLQDGGDDFQAMAEQRPAPGYGPDLIEAMVLALTGFTTDDLETGLDKYLEEATNE